MSEEEVAQPAEQLPKRTEDRPRFWYKRELGQIVEVLETGRPVMICGLPGCGKTVLAEAAATSIEPKAEKRFYHYLLFEHDEQDYQETKAEIEESEPTVVVLDEVSFDSLKMAEKLLEVINKIGSKLIITVNLFRGEVGEQIRKDLRSRAEESGYQNVVRALTGIEIIELPDPEWETVEEGLERVSRRFHDRHIAPASMAAEVRDPDRLEKLLTQNTKRSS
jgi:ABC-type glutathione transport system ATPase component